METVVEMALHGLRFLGELIWHIIFEAIGEAFGRLCGWIWRHVHGWVVWTTGLSELAVPVSMLLIIALIAGVFIAIVKIGQAIVT